MLEKGTGKDRKELLDSPPRGLCMWYLEISLGNFIMLFVDSVFSLEGYD
jgi:hypothetical protein